MTLAQAVQGELLIIAIVHTVLELVLTMEAVGNNLFLGFWTGNSIHGFRQGDYMVVYAALGLAQAFFSFLTSFAFACVSCCASIQRGKLMFLSQPRELVC